MKALTSSAVFIEPLEARVAPAAFVNPTTATYTDQDGDLVTVKFTKPILTAMNVATVIATSASGAGEHLDTINLNGIAAATGTGITVTAKVAGNGDGLANVGTVSSQVDLGAVSIRGDLTNILAGDTADTKSPGLKSLTVQSFGYANFVAGTTSADSVIRGALGSLKVKNDFIGVHLLVRGNSFDHATIGAVNIGGTIGGTSAPTSGVIDADGSIGAVKVGGSIFGGSGTDSGQIYTNHGKIASVTVGGSIRGGALPNSGGISAALSIGPVKIGHDLIGGGASSTGSIYSGTGLASVTIGGSVIGGPGGFSGVISSNGEIGPVKIGGDLRGGGTDNSITDSGEIFAFDHSIASVTIGGDAVAAFGSFNGCILANENIGAVKIGGIVYSTGDGYFTIRASGKATQHTAIKSLTVTGGVSHALVLAGYGFNNTAVSGEASIGAVKVGGNWLASSIVAGVKNTGGLTHFGDGNDVLIDPHTVVAKIASITIGGAVGGTTGGTDHFGFLAQQIGKLTVAGSKIPLDPKAFDLRPMGTTGDFSIVELSGNV